MFIVDRADTALATARAEFDARMIVQMDAERHLRETRARFDACVDTAADVAAAEVALAGAVEAVQAARARVRDLTPRRCAICGDAGVAPHSVLCPSCEEGMEGEG